MAATTTRAKGLENAAGHPTVGVERGRHHHPAVGEDQVVDVVAHRAAPAESHRLQLAHRAEHRMCHGQVPADYFRELRRELVVVG